MTTSDPNLQTLRQLHEVFTWILIGYIPGSSHFTCSTNRGLRHSLMSFTNSSREQSNDQRMPTDLTVLQKPTANFCSQFVDRTHRVPMGLPMGCPWGAHGATVGMAPRSQGSHRRSGRSWQRSPRPHPHTPGDLLRCGEPPGTASPVMGCWDDTHNKQ